MPNPLGCNVAQPTPVYNNPPITAALTGYGRER